MTQTGPQPQFWRNCSPMPSAVDVATEAAGVFIGVFNSCFAWEGVTNNAKSFDFASYFAA